MGDRHSLRRRVAIGIALLTLLVVAVHSIALYVIIDDREEEQINNVVADEMQGFIARYRADPASAPPRSQNLSARVARNAAERAALPPHLRDLAIGMHEVFVNGEEMHVAVRVVENTWFYLVYDVSHHEAQLREILWLLAFGVVVTAIVASVLGYLLAGLLTEPVAALAARVAALGPDRRPDAPLASHYRDREVRRLAEAFDAYMARMSEFVSREQSFTADVSHELRTPLTAIHTGCELLLNDTDLPEEIRQRIRRIDRAAERMGGVIQSLLLLARAGQPTTVESVDLHGCAEEAADPLREMLAERGIALRNDIPRGLSQPLDRTALGVVLSNLLRNAADSMERGEIVCRAGDGWIEIEDTGRGIPADELPRVFERHYRGRGARDAEGYGIGLSLVGRIVERQGWGLSLDSVPGRGTRARLRLAATG